MDGDLRSASALREASPERVPWFLSASLVMGVFGILLWWEYRRPLRPTVEAKRRRLARNLAVAALGAVALQLTERPVTARLTTLVERHRWGLLQQARLPVWLEVPLAGVLLDYTLYIWHVLTHRASWLWRFHVVHHLDLDLDTSTALRFHCAELILSVAWRAGQVLVLGVSPLAVSVWQTALLLSILFHHANVWLPIRTERWLCRLIVTPRVHGIHHSIVREETDSNWSSGLTVWDWLHGTLRLNVPQDAVTIGVPAYREAAEITLAKVLVLPLGKQRPTWQLPAGGRPTRPPSPVAPDQLLA
jgi:sterol desaturase/sphingolipid hydroxylase (fatty acid hydroxylase superfamily)